MSRQMEDSFCSSEGEMKIGDTVKFTGTSEQDIYHGECVGKIGILRQLHPWIGVDFNSDGSIYSTSETVLVKTT
jgi:hypothetical protein